MKSLILRLKIGSFPKCCESTQLNFFESVPLKKSFVYICLTIAYYAQETNQCYFKNILFLYKNQKLFHPINFPEGRETKKRTTLARLLKGLKTVNRRDRNNQQNAAQVRVSLYFLLICALYCFVRVSIFCITLFLDYLPNLRTHGFLSPSADEFRTFYCLFV